MLKEKNSLKEKKVNPLTAIDAVIIPPSHILNLATNLSQRLSRTSPFVLNTENRFPHISILMGYINNDSEASKTIAKIGRKRLPIDLIISRIEQEENEFDGKYFYHLVIEPNDQLLEIQSQLIDELSRVEDVFPTQEAYIVEPKETIVSDVINYVKTFDDYQGGADKYNPHITLGAGEKGLSFEDFNLPVKFTADSIALCQLGNYCTCRRILSLYGQTKANFSSRQK